MKAKTILVLMSLMISSFSAFSQQSISGLFNSNGLERGFTGAVPNAVQQPLRLVILFHGTGENAYSMESRGFQSFLGTNTLVVYPIAFDRMAGFNGTDTIDDFKMVEDLIAHLDSSYTIDTSDICIGGFSSGAAFTYNLVCDFNSPTSTRPYQFKAFAIVSGFADSSYTSNCPVISQVPLIAFHGTSDPIALYNGGILNWIDSIPALPTESIIDFWARNINGCNPNPTVTILPDRVTEQFGNSYPELLEYHCPYTKNTKLYRIVQGFHAWPSGQDQNDFYQNTNMDINASALIADFFASTSTLSASETDLEPNLVSVYPIPTSGFLSIETTHSINRVDLFNVSGKNIFSALDPVTSIDLKDFLPGIYFLHIKTNAGTDVKKIIKQ